MSLLNSIEILERILSLQKSMSPLMGYQSNQVACILYIALLT